MHKYWSVYISAVLILLTGHLKTVSAQPPSPKSDWEKMNLKGKVKELTVDECVMNSSKKDTIRICKITKHYLFNEQGFLVQEKTYVFAQLREKLIYQYLPGNIITKIHHYKNDSVLDAISEFTYEQGARQMQVTITNADQSPNARYVYRLDEQGRTIELTGFNLKTGGHQFVTYTYVYDTLGHVLEDNFNEHKIHYSYTFDAQNRIAQRIALEKNTSETTLYIYDAQGNCNKEISKKGNRKTETNYAIDHSGNWTNKKLKESKERMIYTDRKIQYY